MNFVIGGKRTDLSSVIESIYTRLARLEQAAGLETGEAPKAPKDISSMSTIKKEWRREERDAGYRK